ncbi:hypothetical protein MAPG_03795 [Magnaporthiopsis poae ATCC 64411]|uniref:Uncharacterized protein n=1 Tax=Magnaporthiopsis poae (strain ATCC 64411 / 73-15) TaxID=644358 RepID=A0A0C4DV00_MAGP6|nr:hypothetical protein MAPG_03795 [Magnaporthiopsis poae ATCC 64411]
MLVWCPMSRSMACQVHGESGWIRPGRWLVSMTVAWLIQFVGGLSFNLCSASFGIL